MLRDEEANLEAGLALLDEKMAGHEWDDAQETAEALLAASPDHPALNLRMLEILFARGEKDAFLGLASKLSGSGFGADHPLFWSQVESMGQQLAPGDTLFSPQRGTALDQRPAEGEDLDGMLTTLESHLDRGDETLRGEAAEVLGEAAEELGNAAVLGGEDAVEFDPEIAAEQTDAPGDTSLQEPPEDAVEFETVATLDDAGTEAIEPPVLEDTLEFDLDALGTGEPAPEAGAPPAADNVVALNQDEPAGEAVSEEDVETKLDLARAFLDLGDTEGARSILEEVVSEGNDRQREEASNLLQNTA
jgi:pilus assembly protein FimV